MDVQTDGRVNGEGETPEKRAKEKSMATSRKEKTDDPGYGRCQCQRSLAGAQWYEKKKEAVLPAW